MVKKKLGKIVSTNEKLGQQTSKKEENKIEIKEP